MVGLNYILRQPSCVFVLLKLNLTLKNEPWQYFDLDSDFFSENLFCIDYNDVIDNDNNAYMIATYIQLLIYISCVFIFRQLVLF